MESENPLNDGGVTISKKNFKGNSERSQPTEETRDDAEDHNDFWSIEGDFIYRSSC